MRSKGNEAIYIFDSDFFYLANRHSYIGVPIVMRKGVQNSKESSLAFQPESIFQQEAVSTPVPFIDAWLNQ